jgi:Flp pilus assembly protein TadG
MIGIRSLRRWKSSRRGAAAVECAVIAPVIVLIVFGSIQVGQMVHVSRTVSDASREGARQAAAPRVKTTDDVTNAVNDYLAQAFPGVPSSTVRNATTVTVRNSAGTTIPGGDLTTVTSGDSVSVEVRFDSNAVRWSNDHFNIYGNVLRTVSVMRRQ